MPDLFAPTAKELVLHADRSAAIDAARGLYRQGKRRPILCAPTGSGKTITAMGVMRGAARKGSRSVFITDRNALVDQTVAVADEYGIDCGVMQAEHWRQRRDALVQVVSALTLARRLGTGGYVDHFLRDLQFVLIDECHTLYLSTLDWLATLPDDVAVIGLTATPFTKGLGKHFDAIINVVTTEQLFANGRLVRPIVYVATEMDTAAVTVRPTGEWDDEGLEREGVKIIGDMVAEYIKRTHEHFGGPVKTIVFVANVAHGEAVCRGFAEVGLNFQNITYRDEEEERKAKIAEFRKDDSAIMGLVSCDALAKGFDVPGVKVGMLGRPLRKSLTTHIQQTGRVMRSAPGKDKALLLDHTGNRLRFLRDVVDVWAHGVDTLDESTEKDRTARTVTEKDRKEMVCFGCHAVLPPGVPVCPVCGRDRPRRHSDVTVVAGTTQKIEMSRQPSSRRFDFDNHPLLRDPVVAYQSFVAWATARKRGDEAAGRRWAAGIFKGVYGRWPSRSFDDLPHKPDLVTFEVESFCRREMARFAKSRSSHAA